MVQIGELANWDNRAPSRLPVTEWKELHTITAVSALPATESVVPLCSGMDRPGLRDVALSRLPPKGGRPTNTA